MSTTVDERVVEMRFDNKHFESNVATSMSTLEKLKRSLKLDGASKGLEDINSAAKRVDMSGLGGAVETVKAKFSALDVVAITALSNITNSAVNAGKQLIKSLSVDQLSAGFQKFSDKTVSVATLVAQGNAIEDVNDQLDRLNWFTDETSYNFTEMVSNIAKFTATGKGLNESVTAMEGIATWAALSGQNAATASRAMYQLSQAMGAGVMRLEDYKSIQNASMDTEEFRQKCLDAGVALKTLKDNGDGTYTSLVEGASGTSFEIAQFANHLTKDMWLTSDVMMKVFNDYSSAVEGIYNAAEEKGMLASEIIDEIYTTAEKKGISTDEAIKSLGYDFDSFALKAFEAAQKARTFSDAIDATKDAVSTGWMKTFEIIFGDAEKATELWTDLANTLYDVFAAGGETRNKILEFALNFSKPWKIISEKLSGIKSVTDKVQNVTDAVGNAIDKLEYFQDIVNRVWRGDFNNQGDDPDRRDLLTKAGYDPRVVQDLVNKGYQYKLTIEDVEASYKKFGLTMEKGTEETNKNSKATDKATESFGKLTDKQLEQAGLTEEEIELYRALEKEADRLGISVSELAEEMSTNDGRTLLIDSFKNFGSVVLDTAKIIKEAWAEIFNPPSTGELAVRLYGIIKSLNEFSEKIRLTDKESGELNDTGKKLKRTFKGVWAIVDILTTVLGGGLKIAFKLVSEVIKAFDLDILDVTASIGDALVAFRDWVLEENALAEGIHNLISKLPDLVDRFKEWYATFKETPAVKKLIDAVNSMADAFDKLISGEIDINEFARKLGTGLGELLVSLPGVAVQLGKDFMAGFSDGLSEGISGIIEDVIEFCSNFISSFAEALGIHSPSVIAKQNGIDWCQGFIDGISEMIQPVIDALQPIIDAVKMVFSSFWKYITDENGELEWDKIFAGAITIESLVILKTFADSCSKIADALTSFSGIFSGVTKTLNSFSKVLDGVAWDFKAKALLKLAISIGILVAAIWVLAQIDDIGKLWNAVGVIATLAVIVVGLAWAMKQFSAASIDINKNGASIKGLQSAILQIGLALLLLAVTVKIIGDMDPDKAERGFKGLAGMAVGMVLFLAAIGGISRYTKDVSGLGGMMTKLSFALLLMAGTVKLIGTLSDEEIGKGIAFAAAFTIFIMAITAVAKTSDKNVSKVGSMAIKLAFSMALLVGVCKLVGMLSTDEMIKGAAFAGAFVLFVWALVAVTKIGTDKKIAKVSGIVLSVSFSLLLMVGVCKIISKLSVGEMIKGALAIAAFTLILKLMIKTLTIGDDKQIAKVSASILAMSTALLLMAGAAVILGMVDLADLAKGIVAVSILGAIVSLMAHSLKGANDVKGSLIVMAVVIALLAASIVALSLIDDKKSLVAATAAMSAVMGMFTLMMQSLKALEKGKISIGALVTLAGVVAILAGIVVLLSHGIKDPKSAIVAAGSLAVLMLSMSVVLKILNTMGTSFGNALKGALSLTALAIPLLAFVGVLALMSGVENAMNNVIALTILAGALTLLLIPLALIGNFIGPALLGVLSLTAMAVPLLAFVGVLKLMDGIEDASSKIKALTVAMTAMTLLLGVLAIVGLGGPAAIIGIGSLVVLFTAIGGLAVAIGALMEKFPSIQNFLDTGLPVLEQLAGSIGTMVGKFVGGIGEGLSDSLVKMGDDISQFMSKLAEASDNASGIKGESFDGVKKLMEVMLAIGGTSVVTSITDFVTGIFNFGDDSMDKFQKDGVAFFNAMKAIGEASSEVNINEEAMDSVIGVAQKMSTLQSSLEPIGGVIDWFTGRDDLGTFGVNILAFVSSMKLAFTVLENSELNTEAMDSVIGAATSLSDLQSHLEPIGGVIDWFTGRDDLGTFGVSILDFVSSMKLAFSVLGNSEFNIEAMDSIINAASSLSELQSHLEPIGGVISWFTGRDDLGTFGVNILAFVSSMKLAFSVLENSEFNTEAMNSIISAATSLAELQSHLEPIGGVIDWFTGRDDLGTFGVSVEAFITSMKTAMATLDGVTLNEEALTSVISAAAKLAELQSSLEPMGGVISWFTGRSDLGTFGTNLGLFAEAMAKLKTGMGENGITAEVVASVTNAGNALIALQEALPEEHWFDGKMNLSDFSKRINDFAEAMSGFSSKVSDIDSTAVSTAINTAYRIKNLITSLSDLDTSGLVTFTGVGTGGFGADGAAYKIAQAIAAFSNKVSDINTEAVSTSVWAAQRLKTLINSLSTLDTSGVELFKPAEIGKEIKNYADKVSGIDSELVSSSITSANRLKMFINSLTSLDSSGIGNFKVGSIGTSLKTYSDSISGINIGAVSASINAANRVKNFIASLSGLDTSGVGSFKSAIDKLSTVNIGNLVKAFSGASTKLASAGAQMISGLVKGIQSKLSSVKAAINSLIAGIISVLRSSASKFESAGGALVTRMSGGMTSKKKTVSAAITSCLSEATSSIRGKRESFYSAGSYLVSGLASGISDNSYKVAAKAKAMAEAAVDAAREALKINSPSKVFREIGSGIPEGFAIGIGMLGGEVNQSVTDMASQAITSTRRSMATILDALSGDIDAQPTIRPVVDLSDVKVGANAIDGMFSGVQSVGVRSNLYAINSAMNSRLQNGSTNDIISAIDKLRSDLNGTRGDVYNFGDFTYDDGDGISDAIQTLVRAAKMGRRV